MESRGLRSDRLETGSLWDEALSGHMCATARLYQDRCGAVGDPGLGSRMFSSTKGESRGVEGELLGKVSVAASHALQPGQRVRRASAVE